MKLILATLTAIILTTADSSAQQHYVRAEPGIAAAIAAKCDKTTAKWAVEGDKLIRTYENGYKYALIDTAGLYIYTRVLAEEVTPTSKNNARYKAVTEGYFGVDGCSEIYRMNYPNLRAFLKEHNEFVRAAKGTPNAEYLAPASDGKSTKINELYRKHTRN